MVNLGIMAFDSLTRNDLLMQPQAFVHDLIFRPREEIHAAQELRFAATMDLVCTHHPHYRQLFAKLGLSRADFQSTADLARLPLTTKHDFMGDPQAFLLGASDVEPEMQVVWDTMYTAGTSTGKPTPFVSTAYDYYHVIALYARILGLRGVRGDDLIANLCPLTVYPHGAYHRVSAAGAALKIPVVNLVPGRPSPHFHLGSELDEVVEGIERTRATILWGVTSYVRRVLMRAAELGADFSRVRLAYITGEAVTPALRANFEQCLQAAGARQASINVSYGITEIQGGFTECCPGGGFHNPLPEDIHVQVVDPESHQPLPEGERGLVVISHLNRRGTLLLRYSTGDLSVLSRSACPHCGATTDRFTEMPQRADDLVKIKGMLVNPTVVEAAVLAVEGVSEYQALVEREIMADPFSMDRLRIRIAGAENLADKAPLVSLAVKQATGVTPLVECVQASAIYGPNGSLKLKRFVDQRNG